MPRITIVVFIYLAICVVSQLYSPVWSQSGGGGQSSTSNASNATPDSYDPANLQQAWADAYCGNKNFCSPNVQRDNKGKLIEGEPMRCPGCEWPAKMPDTFTKKLTGIEREAIKEVLKAAGIQEPQSKYPVTGAQFARIMAAATVVGDKLDKMPERSQHRAREEQNIQNQQNADTAAGCAQQEAACAIDSCRAHLKNFTVDDGNKWNKLRNELFVPIGILLLLPGAIATQVKATLAQGFAVLGDVSPLEGLQRSIIAIFLIPASVLVVNYGIDLSNSISFTIQSEYKRIFGSDMYEDAMSAQVSAFPVRDLQSEKNHTPQQPANMDAPVGKPAETALGKFNEKFCIREQDPVAGKDNTPADRTREQVPYVTNAHRGGFNGMNAALTTTWSILCAFQQAYLYYLWFVGPIMAGLWVWPMKQLRDAFPNWCEGVITLCFWSLFWHTTILVMACFRGVEGETLLFTALNFLATACVKFAFDFAGLVKAAGQEAGKAAEKAMQGNGAGKGGAGGGKGGGTSAAGAHPATASGKDGTGGAAGSNIESGNAGSSLANSTSSNDSFALSNALRSDVSITRGGGGGAPGDRSGSSSFAPKPPLSEFSGSALGRVNLLDFSTGTPALAGRGGGNNGADGTNGVSGNSSANPALSSTGKFASGEMQSGADVTAFLAKVFGSSDNNAPGFFDSASKSLAAKPGLFATDNFTGTPSPLVDMGKSGPVDGNGVKGKTSNIANLAFLSQVPMSEVMVDGVLKSMPQLNDDLVTPAPDDDLAVCAATSAPVQSVPVEPTPPPMQSQNSLPSDSQIRPIVDASTKLDDSNAAPVVTQQSRVDGSSLGRAREGIADGVPTEPLPQKVHESVNPAAHSSLDSTKSFDAPSTSYSRSSADGVTIQTEEHSRGQLSSSSGQVSASGLTNATQSLEDHELSETEHKIDELVPEAGRAHHSRAGVPAEADCSVIGPGTTNQLAKTHVGMPPEHARDSAPSSAGQTPTVIQKHVSHTKLSEPSMPPFSAAKAGSKQIGQPDRDINLKAQASKAKATQQSNKMVNNKRVQKSSQVKVEKTDNDQPVKTETEEIAGGSLQKQMMQINIYKRIHDVKPSEEEQTLLRKIGKILSEEL